MDWVLKATPIVFRSFAEVLCQKSMLCWTASLRVACSRWWLRVTMLSIQAYHNFLRHFIGSIFRAQQNRVQKKAQIHFALSFCPWQVSLPLFMNFPAEAPSEWLKSRLMKQT